MDFPNRKQNRLKNYDYSESRAYFITVCTQGKKQNLSEIAVGDGFPVPKLSANGKIVCEFIEAISEKFSDVKINNYVVMPDHIHLLITIVSKDDGTGNPSPTIGNIMGWFKYQTTKNINLRNNKSGERFWQRSYYDHVIRNEEDFAETYTYIDLNPRRWVEKRTIHSKENEKCYIQAQETRA